MIYEQILFEKIQKNNASDIDIELSMKQQIAEEMEKQNGNEFYGLLIDLGLDDYLTTNYDYAFNKSFESKYKCSSKNLSTEILYSIRRHTLLSCNDLNLKCKLWHIHGEIGFPKTISLGLDHYCGTIGKIDSYLKGTYSIKSEEIKIKKMEMKLRDNNFDDTSWIELFFTNNIHIIGLGMDYSETDIWWILTKRARLKRCNMVNGNIFFYHVSPKALEKDKEKFLKSLDVKIVNIPSNHNSYDYKMAISEMKKNF